MSDPNDAAALTAVVLHEEETRRDAQAAAEAGELLPDDLLPGVGGELMPLRDGLKTGGIIDDPRPAAREHDRDARPGRAPGARARHPAHARRRQDHAARAHLVRRRGARRRHAPVRMARRPLRADQDPRRRHLRLGRVHGAHRPGDERLADGASRVPARDSAARRASRSRRRSSPTSTRSACARGCSRWRTSADPPGWWSGRSSSARSPGWAGGVEGWRWAMVAVAIPAVFVAVVLLFTREPERGRNEQEAILGRLLDSSQDPPVRLSAAAARLRKVKSFRYLILGIGVLGFALVSVPVRLSFLFDETYHFDAYKRGWVLSLTYLPALLVIPLAGRMGDRLFRRDPRNAVRIFGVLVIAYGVFLTIGSQLERGRTAHRARRDRQRVPARGVHASRPDDLRGRAVPDAFAGIRADRLLHLPARRVLRRPRGRGDRVRLRRANRAVGRRASGRAHRRRARDVGQPLHETRHLARRRRAARRAGGAAPGRCRSRERARCSRCTTSTSATGRCRCSST